MSKNWEQFYAEQIDRENAQTIDRDRASKALSLMQKWSELTEELTKTLSSFPEVVTPISGGSMHDVPKFESDFQLAIAQEIQKAKNFLGEADVSTLAGQMTQFAARLQEALPQIDSRP